PPGRKQTPPKNLMNGDLRPGATKSPSPAGPLPEAYEGLPTGHKKRLLSPTNRATAGPHPTTLTTVFSSTEILVNSPPSFAKWTTGTTMSSSGTRSVVTPVAR